MSEKLKERDYYFLIDRSGSMTEKDTPTGESRFKYAEEGAVAVAKVCEEYDPDGLTVIMFGGKHSVYENVTAAKVNEVFKENAPFGGTVLSGPLQHVFKDYLKNKAAGKSKKNGAICVVITDGAPSDRPEVKKTIIEFTQKLENGDDEFGILFLQVGKDNDASNFMRELDDDLKGAAFDIVDAKTYDQVEEIGIMGALEGALDD